jgi:Thioredoxin-like proteins and domains
MFVLVEATPNPNTRKFMPGKHLSSIPREFTRTMKGGDPLVHAIFSLPEVKTVLISEDAISITIEDEKGWESALPTLRKTIEAGFSPDYVVDDSHPIADTAVDFDEKDATVVETIRNLLDTRIRPAIARDGGDVVFRSYRDGILGLQMKGACSGCPSSSATLKHGIRHMMQYFVPEVIDVVEV